MTTNYTISQPAHELGRAENIIRIPTTTVHTGGIQVLQPRPNSTEIVPNSTVKPSTSMNSRPQQGLKFQQARPLSSSPSLNSGSTPQKIVVTANQQRQGVTVVRLNNTVGQLPPIQRVIVRDLSQQVPQSPERTITHRFTVKSVDRDPKRQYSTSVDRLKPATITPINISDLFKQQLEAATKYFNEKVAEEQAKNNHELKRLEQRLKESESDLQMKHQEIHRLRKNFDQALREQSQQHKLVLQRTVSEAVRQQKAKIQGLSANQQQDIDRNFEYITGKMRDIEAKVRMVVENQSILEDNARLNLNRTKLFMLQLDEVKRDFIEKYHKTIVRIKSEIYQNITNRQGKLQSLQQEIGKLYGTQLQSQQLAQSIHQKVKSAEKLLRQFSQKTQVINEASCQKLDIEKIVAPLQQDMTEANHKLCQLQRKSNSELRVLSKQINGFQQSVILLSSKASNDNVKLQQLHCLNQKQVNRIKEMESKQIQLEEKNHQLFKTISSLEIKQLQNNNLLIQKQQNLEQIQRRNIDFQTKCTEIQGMMARNSFNLDEAINKNQELQIKNQQNEVLIRKAHLKLEQVTRKYEQLMRTQNSDRKLLQQIQGLKYCIQGLQKQKFQLSSTISELTYKLNEHDSRVRQLELLKSRLSSQKQNTESQNRELHKVISQMSTKTTELDSKGIETESMIKTQSMRFFDPQANKSIMFSSKGSLRSQNQMLNKTRSNRLQSSDDQSNCSTLHREMNSKYTEKETTKRWAKQDIPQKLIKLKQILKLNRKPLPLACEVDETGYLKDCDEGTYIYDKQHNLFVLSKEQLSRAVKNRIISL